MKRMIQYISGFSVLAIVLIVLWASTTKITITVAVDESISFHDTCVFVNGNRLRGINENSRTVRGAEGIGNKEIRIESAGYKTDSFSFFSNGTTDEEITITESSLERISPIEIARSLDVGLENSSVEIIRADILYDNEATWLAFEYPTGFSKPRPFFAEFDRKSCAWSIFNAGEAIEIEPGSELPLKLYGDYL